MVRHVVKNCGEVTPFANMCGKNKTNSFQMHQQNWSQFYHIFFPPVDVHGIYHIGNFGYKLW